MLASRLASRTIISSERDVGTQTSLSFETSSSIREEMLALMELDGEDEEDKEVEYHREADMSLDELRQIYNSHLLDPNYDSDMLLRESATLSRWTARAYANSSDPRSSSYRLDYYSTTTGAHGGTEGGATEDELWPGSDWGFDEGEEDSVYAEVRAAVSNTDDPSMPTNTLRVWVLGTFGALVLAAVNQFMYYRFPSISVASLVVQLMAYPLGVFMARVLPRGNDFINDGHFNIKEHTLITIMAGVAQGTAYATNIITVQRYYYDQSWSFVFQILLVLSTQLIGFSMGGVLRRFLVWPASMIWPASLVNTALLNTLHSVVPAGVKGHRASSRDVFFYKTAGLMALWSFFPGYLFEALATFDWITWIWPASKVVNLVFGQNSGIGLSAITFDWGVISTIGNPLAMPWWSGANVLFGFVFFVCGCYPALYFTGAFYTSALPFASSLGFDRFGNIFNTSRVVNSGNATLNEEAYRSYSEIYLSISFVMAYAMSFAGLAATLVHVTLYYRSIIWRQVFRKLNDEPDIHARLMRKYREVPQWWYLAVFLLNLAFAIGAVQGWPTQMPVWTLFLALFLAFSFALPIGIVQAITNTQAGLNVISELIIGYLYPSRPVAMMIFKTYCYITLTQGLTYVNDAKLAHYMKVPPRQMFASQVWATVVASVVQVGISAWMYKNIPHMCQSRDLTEFWCPPAKTFGTSSVVWGLIGPERQFSLGRIYTTTLLGFLVGGLTPIPFYFLARRHPNRWFKFVNMPVVFSVTALVPPYLPINILAFCYTNFATQFLVRRYRFGWWSRYNYILSAGLSAGYALSVIFIFFALQLPLGGSIGENTIQSWWGNTVFRDTLDWNGTRWVDLKPGETIGPDTWS